MPERPQTTLHKKYPLQFYLNTLGTTLHRWKPYAMLSKNIQTTLHKKKFLCNVLLILFGQNCIAENPVQCSPRGSRQLCIRKMSNSMLPAYAILSQTLQVTLHRKYSGNAGNVVWTTSGHFLYICIYQVLHVKKYKVILSLQGHSEGTSSGAFEVLIIICQIYFINLFIFNCLKLNIKLFIFKLFDVKFLFSENHVFRKQKRTAV